MAVGRKTGGRQKGTPNKATAALAAEIAASGQTPLDFMIGRMRDESLGPQERFEAAKAAAPYTHPRLAAVEAIGDVEHRYIARMPAPVANMKEWQDRYAPPGLPSDETEH